MSFFKFFESPKGRRFTLYATLTAAVSAFSVNYFPHTFLVTKHREIVSLYKEGAERQMTEPVKKRVEKAIEILKINEFERKYIKPFVVTGFDLYHFGSTKFRFGALIGVPINYTYTATDDIDKIDIIIRGKPVDWSSHGGMLFQESLVLSPEEQIFGIVREILQLSDNSVYFNSFIPTGSIFAYYAATSTLNSKLRLFYRPLSLRVAIYGLVGLFTFGVYSLIVDFSQIKYDTEIDDKLASFGRGFIEAGIGFYDKLLKKNIACRELTGDNSEYTALGNQNSYLRHKSVPLTERKSFFEKKLKELDEAEKLRKLDDPEQNASET